MMSFSTSFRRSAKQFIENFLNNFLSAAVLFLEFKPPWAITTREWPERFSIMVPMLHSHSVSLPFQLSYGVKLRLQER